MWGEVQWHGGLPTEMLTQLLYQEKKKKQALKF